MKLTDEQSSGPSVEAGSTVRCPQCEVAIPDDAWNCPSCRVNVYWARRHYEDLARIRQDQGLPARASTPPFLIKTHENAIDDRAGRGGGVEHRVRKIARIFMRKPS
jgi:hypothetical protein